MLKNSLSRFAAAALGTFAITVGPPAVAQFTPTPAVPRQDTVRTQDDELAQDSRVGGALAPETPPGGVETGEPPVVDAPPEGIVAEGDRNVLRGRLVNIAKNRLILAVPAPGDAPAREVDFRVPDGIKIMRNGKPARLNALHSGDFVRLVTAPGDRDLVVAIVAADASEGSLNRLEGDPNANSEEIGSDEPTRPAGAGGEEAVLPLGLEVYGVKNAALVTEMSADGPAARAGVHIGDLILAINGTPIVNAEKIEEFLAKSSTRPVLTIQRGKKRMNVAVAPIRAAKNALVDRAGIQRALGGYGYRRAPVTINPGAIGAGPVTAPGGFVRGRGAAPANANRRGGAASDPNVPQNDFRSPGARSEPGPAGVRSPGAPQPGAINAPRPGTGAGATPGDFRSPGAPATGNPQTPQTGTNVAPATGQSPTTGQ